MIDARSGGAGGADCQELRPVADAQHGGSPLVGLDWHAEQPLVELERALRVGDAERHVIQRAGTNRPGAAGLRQEPRCGQQRWKRNQEVATIDACIHEHVPLARYNSGRS